MNVRIEKLIFGGQALGRTEDGKTILVWNALPGELVNVENPRKRKGVLQGVATEIIEPSPDRVEPKEKMFLSTSPWQILTPEKELEWKKIVAEETYKKLGGFELNSLEVVADDQLYGYRNKMEFSFFWDDNEEITLAFFARGSKYRQPVTGSLLAEPVINAVAANVVAWLKTEELTPRELKSLIVRSNGKGQAIASLFVKDKVEFDRLPELDSQLLGFHVFYSDYRSPASVPTELLESRGDMSLVATLDGIDLQFGLLSFFQVNIELFPRALQDISLFIEKDAHVIDYYSGVGAIGLPIAKHVSSVQLIESNPEAAAFATDNIDRNKITNATARLSEAEKMTDGITSDSVIILDPPRAGLHQDVTKVLLEKTPKRIVYLSCNLSTQARDVAQLLREYTISFSRLYNFFPRTPHVEGLIVLDRKSV